MTSVTHCPACHKIYPSDEGHDCRGSVGIVRTAAREWIKCSQCNNEYPAGTSHTCPTTVGE